MRPIVTDRVAWSVCLSVMIMSLAKPAELIEMPLALWTRVGPRNRIRWQTRIDWSGDVAFCQITLTTCCCFLIIISKAFIAHLCTPVHTCLQVTNDSAVRVRCIQLMNCTHLSLFVNVSNLRTHGESAESESETKCLRVVAQELSSC